MVVSDYSILMIIVCVLAKKYIVSFIIRGAYYNIAFENTKMSLYCTTKKLAHLILKSR